MIEFPSRSRIFEVLCKKRYRVDPLRFLLISTEGNFMRRNQYEELLVLSTVGDNFCDTCIQQGSTRRQAQLLIKLLYS